MSDRFGELSRGQRHLAERVMRKRLAVPGAGCPCKMLRGLGSAPLGAQHQSEVIMRVTRVLIAAQRGRQVLRGRSILAAAIERKTERNAGGSKSRIAFERFAISRARRALVALFVGSQSLD